MSIKKFFEKHRQGKRNYADYANEKETFSDVESQYNAESLIKKEKIYVPQVDYSKPHNFVKFGSAYMYYSGALNRIVDYYPYAVAIFVESGFTINCESMMGMCNPCCGVQMMLV